MSIEMDSRRATDQSNIGDVYDWLGKQHPDIFEIITGHTHQPLEQKIYLIAPTSVTDAVESAARITLGAWSRLVGGSDPEAAKTELKQFEKAYDRMQAAMRTDLTADELSQEDETP